VENCLEGSVVDLVPAPSFSQSISRVKKRPYSRLVHEPKVSIAQ
jgi:hypothetical protein